MCMNMQKEMTEISERISHVESERDELKKENCVLKDRLVTVEKTTEKMERQFKDNNLIIFGMKQKKNESGHECEQSVRTLISEKLQLSDDILLEKVHRLSAKEDSPIIARFTERRQKTAVLKARQKLKGTDIFVNEDFTERVRDVRRKLMPVLRDARESGKKATLVYDHLIVDGKKVFLDERGHQQT